MVMGFPSLCSRKTDMKERATEEEEQGSEVQGTFKLSLTWKLKWGPLRLFIGGAGDSTASGAGQNSVLLGCSQRLVLKQTPPSFSYRSTITF